MIIEITSVVTMGIVAVLGAWKVMKRVACKLGCFSSTVDTTDAPNETTKIQQQ